VTLDEFRATLSDTKPPDEWNGIVATLLRDGPKAKGRA